MRGTILEGLLGQISQKQDEQFWMRNVWTVAKYDINVPFEMSR